MNRELEIMMGGTKLHMHFSSRSRLSVLVGCLLPQAILHARKKIFGRSSESGIRQGAAARAGMIALLQVEVIRCEV